MITLSKQRKQLPPLGTIVLSRYGREMKVVQHYTEAHLVGLNPVHDGHKSDVPAVAWPPEWCICSGDQMPWEYYEFHGAIRENLQRYRQKLLQALVQRCAA